MMGFGICMAPRDFECALCGRPFTRETADFILPADTVCDACLAELGPLDENALREEIGRRVALRRSEPPPTRL